MMSQQAQENVAGSPPKLFLPIKRKQNPKSFEETFLPHARYTNKLPSRKYPAQMPACVYT